MKLTFWKTLFDTDGAGVDWTWERFAAWLNEPREFIEGETPGWSAAEFVGNKRKKELVVTVTALALDFDGTVDRQTIEGLFEGHKYVAHSSKSNTDETPSYRVVVALSHRVDSKEYAFLWSGFARKLSGYVDQAPKDGSRFWYAPCRLPTTKWEHWEHNGEPVDVDSVIATERERQRKEFKERETISSTKIVNAEKVVQRCQKYVDRMDGAVAGQHGHTQTLKVAIVIYRGFSLDGADAWSILAEYNLKCSPPWNKKELERKASEAKRSKAVGDGWLLCDTPQNKVESKRLETVEWKQPDDDSFYENLAEPELSQTEEVQREEPQPKPEEKPKSVAERYGIISLQDLQMIAYRYLTDDRPKSAAVTGIREVDEALGNLGRGLVTGFGAPTNWGKTGLSVMSSLCSKGSGCDVLYFSFEDVSLLFGRRILARQAAINATCIRDKEIMPEEWKRITRAISTAPDEPFFVDCIGKSVEYCGRIIHEYTEERVRLGRKNEFLVVVDYLQRMKTDARTQDRRNQVSYVTSELSDAIKSVDACGFVLSQLRRLKDDEEPELSDLKESGDIECFFDNIILGWKRTANDTTERVVAVKKNKDGPLLLDPIAVQFDPITASFIASCDAGMTAAELYDREEVNDQFDTGF
jgi:replicative DNA helicase